MLLQLRGGLVALILAAIAAIFALNPIGAGQATVNGLAAGSYFALGAIGLTLVYGVLRLVNFAHGDMLTFGAYVALLLNVGLAWPFLPSVLAAIAATALLGLLSELVLWRPMRRKGAGTFQLLLMTIGFALLLRNGIQFFAGSGMASFKIDIVASASFFGLHLGQMQLVVVIVGFAVLCSTGLMLRYTSLGKQMRALSDNPDLAEASGIDTQRIVLATWLIGGGLAGLAGVLYASSIGVMNPNLGFSLLLAFFAASVLGGVGNAYGALLGGVLIGLAQEWATLVIDPRWKPAVGFSILILTLLFLPQGLLGRRRVL
jgi:neutral amino acid transport system permease protein